MFAATRRVCSRATAVVVCGVQGLGLVAAAAVVVNSAYELVTRDWAEGTTANCDPDDLLARLNVPRPEVARAALTAALALGVVAVVVPRCFVLDGARRRPRAHGLSSSALVSSATTSL